MENTSLLERIKKADRVFLIGNGGSYANAQHIANDLIACGKAAFTIDPATLTASANDHGYSGIFSRWLAVVARPTDILIALSGSGTSPNIIQALAEAQRIGMDFYLVTNYLQTRDMQESEEDQILLGHELMRALRDAR